MIMAEQTDTNPDIVVLDVPLDAPPKKKRTRRVSVGITRDRRTKAQTQVTLQDMETIKRLAKARKLRAADVVREAISAYLKKHGTP
jgi:hypothetical protein